MEHFSWMTAGDLECGDYRSIPTPGYHYVIARDIFEINNVKLFQMIKLF